MHGAFDVGMQNKRLTLFVDKTGHTSDPAVRLAPAHNSPVSTKHAAPEPIGPWLVLSALYFCLCLGDYFVLPSAHGTKVALAVVAGSPLVLTLMHVHQYSSQSLVAVTTAHMMVTLVFACDPMRLHQELVAPSKLLLAVAGTSHHLWQRRHAAGSPCLLYASGALYVLTLAVLPVRVLLPLQQAFLLMDAAGRAALERPPMTLLALTSMTWLVMMQRTTASISKGYVSRKRPQARWMLWLYTGSTTFQYRSRMDSCWKQHM